MVIRKATEADIEAVAMLYEEIHTAEETGKQTIGWVRGIYPMRATAEMAYRRNDLFVMEDAGIICGAGIINQTQDDSYRQAQWKFAAADDQVCVLHTLVISPKYSGKGYGKVILEFYEQYARETGCMELRLDTNLKNVVARSMYRRHGYDEIGIVPTRFNGIPDVKLVLFEKNLNN